MLGAFYRVHFCKNASGSALYGKPAVPHPDLGFFDRKERVRKKVKRKKERKEARKKKRRRRRRERERNDRSAGGIGRGGGEFMLL